MINENIKKYLSYFFIALFASLMTVGLTIVISPNQQLPDNTISNNTTAENTELPKGKTSSTEVSQLLGETAISEARNKVAPSVVYIDTVSVVTRRNNFLPFGFEEFFPSEFFEQQQEQRGTGSGFIIRENGYILTNEHVVRGAQKLEVTLYGGKKFAGKVVGSDSYTDLAVVKIDATNLPAVEFGNSDELTPGQWVVAIGNPYGFHDTVTAGIISAVGRSLENPNETGNLIQTDAAINPGNSGGPLVNLAGKVVGINEAIIANAQGLGFAIPANLANNIVTELIEKGKVERPAVPWLGVALTEINDQIANYYQLSNKEGAIIQVVAGSPAEKAGLKDGDILKEINRVKIVKPEDVVEKVKQFKVGDTIELLIYRDGKLKVYQVKLEERPQQTK